MTYITISFVQLFESFDHNAHTCPFHAYVDATCASFRLMNDRSNDRDHGNKNCCMFSLTKIGRLIVSLILV